MTKFVVLFDTEEKNPESGSISFITWNNPATRAMFEKLFKVTSFERLAAITVTEEGIKAKMVIKE